MEIKVYQLKVQYAGKNEKGKSVIIPKEERKCYFSHIGTVVGENVEPENVWHLTNHSCWNHKEDKDGNTIDEEYSPIVADGCTYIPTEYDPGYTNDDICFEIDGVWHCADSAGWTEKPNLGEAVFHLWRNSIWMCDYRYGGRSFFYDIIDRTKNQK